MVNSNIPTKARKIPQELDLLREPCIRSPRSESPPVLRTAISFADSLRLALPVKTMAVDEYISSSLPAIFPDKIAQKRWTSWRTSSDEIFSIFSRKDSTSRPVARATVAIRNSAAGGSWLAMSELARRIFPETAHKMILRPPFNRLLEICM